MFFRKRSYATIQTSTSSRQSSPEANGSYSLASSQTFSIYASSEEFDNSEKYEVWPAKNPSLVDLTMSLIRGMPEIPGIASSISNLRSAHADNADISENLFVSSRLVEKIEESCNELFVRLQSLVCSRKATQADNSDDETRAQVLLQLSKKISGLKVEIERLEKLMLEDPCLHSDSELEK